MSTGKKISGKVVYQDLEGGFWGIIDDSGKEWLPINMPEQLKQRGKKVTVTIKPADVMTTIMWGQAVEIVSFTTS